MRAIHIDLSVIVVGGIFLVAVIIGSVIGYSMAVEQDWKAEPSHTQSYVGVLESIEYDTNGFGGVRATILQMRGGEVFIREGYYVYELGCNYTITYVTWPNPDAPVSVLSVVKP